MVNLEKGKLPRLPFARIKTAILPEEFIVSLAFVSPEVSAELHEKFQHKDGPANVLSFPLDKNSGEIVICGTEAKRQAPLYGLTFKNAVGYFFIHGLLHLKGMQHGSKMVDEEKKFCEMFQVKHPVQNK